jgi:hypothetical protein
MPVRFRCQFCNQLLGIARRKIGTQVECPTCHNSVTVPAVDSPDAAAPVKRYDPPLFERSDIDDLLGRAPADPPGTVAPPSPDPVAPPAPPPAPWALPPTDFQPEPYKPSAPSPAVGRPGPAPAAGVVLTPLNATLLTVAAVLLLAVAFAAGLLIGRFL